MRELRWRPRSAGEERAPAPPPSRTHETAPSSLDNQTAQSLGAEQAADREAERFMERFPQPTPRDYARFFGREIGGVRLHAGPASGRAAGALGALAFTRGRDIHFADGRLDPRSRQGQRLLAHELAHVRADRGTSHIIRRQEDPNAKGGGGAGFNVQELSPEEFQQQTGIDPGKLPDKKYVSMSDAMRAVGIGLSLPESVRMTDLPLNATGVGWEGAHAWDFAVVNGKLVKVRGFRAELWRHILATGERHRWPLFDPLGRAIFGRGGATATLNRGTPGTFASDWMFPYNPRSSAVFQGTSPELAAEFGKYLDRSAPEFAGEPYTFSPPGEGTPAWFDAYGTGACPPTGNCINLPLEQHKRALGLGPNDPVPFVPEEGAPGRFLDPADEFFFGEGKLGPGLGRTRIGPAMLAAGVIKTGGRILIIYGAINTAGRIAEAEPGAERRMVVSEEAGAWTGSIIGGMLAEALGVALICTGTGPGAFFCLAGVGLAGALLGGAAGHAGGHTVGEKLNDVVELVQDPAKLMEATAVWHSALTGSDSAQQYYEWREIETGEPSPYTWP